MPGADAGRAASDMVRDAGGRGEGGERRARRLCKERGRGHERSHKKRIEGIFESGGRSKHGYAVLTVGGPGSKRRNKLIHTWLCTPQSRRGGADPASQLPLLY